MLNSYSMLVLVFAAVVIAALLFLVLRLRRRNKVVAASPSLWPARAPDCPRCNAAMTPGYALAGRGIIWRPRDGKPIGSFANIGQALDNTLSMDLPPTLNIAWHCPGCALLLLDHGQLVRL